MIPIGDDNSANTIRPYVNYILIAANILVFILFQSMGSNQAFVMSFSTVPQEIITGSDIVGGPAGLLPTPIPVLGTIFTAMFMHGSIAHIAGNMLYLWIFGDNLENRMGHAKYLAFYLICGILATLAHVYASQALGRDMLIPSLGASGAISGVLGGYLILFPRNHLTIEETEALIIHELAHIKQNDFLLNWILLIIETLFFFNPFIKLLASEIRKNRELSCDVEVMKKYYSPLHYANALYKSAAQHLFANAFSITAAQKEGLLLHRILFFTDTNNHFLPKRKLVIVPLLSLTFITLLLAVILPTENKEIKTVSSSFIRTALPFNSEISMPEILSTDYVIPAIPKITVSSKSRSNTVAVSQTASKEKRTKPTGEIEHDAYYNLVPVNYTAQADSVTEIIVSEETAGGNSITRSYKMSYKNGKWEITLLWMVENKKAEDSVHQNIDTTLQHYY